MPDTGSVRGIRTIIRSFSFRLGLTVALMVFTALFGQRLFAHYASVSDARGEAQKVISAHIDEITEGVERYGPNYAAPMVKALTDERGDPLLYLQFSQDGKTVGNLAGWPITGHFKYARDITLTHNGQTLRLLVQQVNYGRHGTLTVAYSLQQLDALEASLPQIIMEEVALALATALIISLAVIWLISRHLQRFNIACARVMRGRLDYRIARRGARDEFDKLAANINQMLDWNTTLIRTARDTSSAIAHDMRTPLSRLRLELRALSERPRLNAETREAVAQHIERVDSLIDMFENILNIAKAESRASTEIFEPVDIRQLVQDVADFYDPALQEKQLGFDLQLPNAPIMLHGDKQLLGQAIMNLIDNAFKYAANGTSVTVALSQNADGIQLCVADHGIGMSPELYERAKERFFRGDKSRHTRGHGLGLSLVNAVAHLHHGTLTLQDNAPGLKVTLTLGMKS